MKRIRKAGMVFLFVVPAIIGFLGYLFDNKSVADAAYMAIRAYLFDADTVNNNFLVEFARWTAPVFTVSGLAIVLKKAVRKVIDFFTSFSSDAIAVYGDTDLKEVVKKNIKHAICVEDNGVLDTNCHIIMFSTDEKSLEFYEKNKEELFGEVYIKLDKNDVYSASLEGVKFFNPCEIVARSFWQENDIRSIIKEEKMKISIVGSDVLARKILSFGLLNNIYSLDQKIEYHIWSEDDFFEKAHGDFLTLNNDTVKYHDNKCAERMAEIASSDRIIITDEIDNEFLSEIVNMTNGEIYIYDPMGMFVNIFAYKSIFTFGRYANVLTEERIKADDLYSFAKELNYQYDLKYSDPPSKTPEEAWSKLNTFKKGSNIASADYHMIRLIVMEEEGKTEVDDVLSEMEHIRWCRYHFLNHWRYGEPRDNEKRIHPCLRPFGKLSREDQIKDTEGIQVLLSLVSKRPEQSKEEGCSQNG